MATKPRKKNKAARATKSATVPRFEIVHEEAPSSFGETWAKLRHEFAPLVEAGRIILGDAYSSMAQAVLEKKEELEDQRAEQKALQRKASRHAPKAVTPLLLEAGSLKKSRKTSASKTS